SGGPPREDRARAEDKMRPIIIIIIIISRTTGRRRSAIKLNEQRAVQLPLASGTTILVNPARTRTNLASDRAHVP
ncbi:Hypothetical predicted protein, partial [Olea europaea subsp. europaea]